MPKKPKKKNLTLKTYQQNERYIKGLLFEVVLKELVKKSGFSEEHNIPQINVKGTKLHGRGAPHQIDIMGVFRLGIPFIQPLLLIGEAKNFKSKISLDKVRSFLGAYVDIMQYSRVNTKAPWEIKRFDILQPRFTYCPVFFSMKGFWRTAQTLMFAHGINYFSYENSPIIEKVDILITRLLKQIQHNKVIDTDFRNLRKLSTIQYLRPEVKKANFDNALEKLTEYLVSVSSYVGVLDKRFPIHILTRKKTILKPRVEVTVESLQENSFIIKSLSKREYGQFSLTNNFLDDYLNYADKYNQLDTVLRQIDIIVPSENNLLFLNLKINEESRKSLIESRIKSPGQNIIEVIT